MLFYGYHYSPTDNVNVWNNCIFISVKTHFFIYKNFWVFFISFSCTVFLFIININIKSMMMMMMQWNWRINGILYQWQLYPDTGYVFLFMSAATLAVRYCFRQLNAKHSVLVFSQILCTAKRLWQAMEYVIFIL